ncbi:hypothetical protein FMUND_9361 [Fusarium mundagurra]|uniref:Uncharacterized protein n=1 Tax=Fusarium mundagurra TaxID=1567541 RepID=A0A8H5YG40_9HYPO|nr:hypothetical protein FMUND_9361 [Fusarium mundagurra]
MTNPNFVSAIISVQDKGMEQAWIKRALEAFPNAESLRHIQGPWDREIPHIDDDELTPASEIQSGASSASSSSDAPIVVSGSRSQSHRHKRHKSGHEGRNKTQSGSGSAPSSSAPSTSGYSAPRSDPSTSSDCKSRRPSNPNKADQPTTTSPDSPNCLSVLCRFKLLPQLPTLASG